jgi:poly-gamma-glutamate capsule biosynthesis protein CapA/YwtB (metallophosphatase superfamily)
VHPAIAHHEGPPLQAALLHPGVGTSPEVRAHTAPLVYDVRDRPADPFGDTAGMDCDGGQMRIYARVATVAVLVTAVGTFVCSATSAVPLVAAQPLRVVKAAEATPGVTPTPTPTAKPTITVTAVGDMLFDSAPKRLIQSGGGRAPFTAVASRLRTADVTLGNLECPLSRRGRAVPNKTFTFQGDPRAVQGLVWAGFDFVSLANNHARDYGETALRDTFTNLSKAKIAFAGAGVDKSAAWKPAVIVRNGARIAFLGFSEIGPDSFAAGTRRPGTAFVGSMTAVKTAIHAARQRADYVIVSFHWGIERDYSPTSRQVREGRAAIDAGADMVLSEHPHVLQGVEFYKQRLIAYSLGNFVFSPGSDNGRDTMILHASLTPNGVTGVSVEPVHIGQNGRPVLQTGAAARRILRIVTSTCNGRHTKVGIRGTIARLRP